MWQMSWSLSASGAAAGLLYPCGLQAKIVDFQGMVAYNKLMANENAYGKKGGLSL